MKYLLDTNVISEIRKPRGEMAVKEWFGRADDLDIYLSVLVLGEIRQGVERLRLHDRARASVVENWLAVLQRDFSSRLLPITDEIAELWGRLNAVRPMPVVDSLLAATALHHGLALVTRNVADVRDSGVLLINPFVV